jgi:hypothetical protein
MFIGSSSSLLDGSWRVIIGINGKGFCHEVCIDC